VRKGCLALGCALLLAAAGFEASAGGGRVYAAAEDVEPLAAGSRVPAVDLTSVRGEQVPLEQVRGEAGALLVFYRGGW